MTFHLFKSKVIYPARDKYAISELNAAKNAFVLFFSKKYLACVLVSANQTCSDSQKQQRPKRGRSSRTPRAGGGGAFIPAGDNRLVLV